MSRLPFDPDQMQEREPRPPERPARRERRGVAHPAEAGHLTVSELAGLIKVTLEERIASPLRVIGEVSNLSRPNHWYFSLKDDSSVVSCVAWASSARRFGFEPRIGDEVVATGHVSHYPPQGRTQFYVSALQPVGQGALQARFEAMCAELRELGYFDEERKRPLPLLPRRVAVVTSADGAAIHDVRSTADQRCRAVGLLVVDVRVQGDGAADEVARAIRWVDANREDLGVDALIVTRGGGSMEDLWTFNERVVADAAFGCSLPLVAAIGHESDTTVIELVADRRAATPTQAAMALVPSAEDLLRQVAHLEHRLLVLLKRRVAEARHRATALARHEAFRDPGARLRRERLRIDALAERLHRALVVHVGQGPRLDAMRGRLHRAGRQVALVARGRLEALERELHAVDPRRVLRRGYSCTMRDGRLVRAVGDVEPGARIVTHVADGSFDSVVGASHRRHARSRTARSSSAGVSPAQMDLFSAPE